MIFKFKTLSHTIVEDDILDEYVRYTDSISTYKRKNRVGKLSDFKKDKMNLYEYAEDTIISYQECIKKTESIMRCRVFSLSAIRKCSKDIRTGYFYKDDDEIIKKHKSKLLKFL